MADDKKDNWILMMEKMGSIRLFSSIMIKKMSLNSNISSQELDMLFKIYLTEQPLSPKDLSIKMGIKKTVISRLIESLYEKKIIDKVSDLKDKRSYRLLITKEGKKAVDSFKSSFTIASAMLIGTLFNFPRVMWIALACMSVYVMDDEVMKDKAVNRSCFNIVVGILFSIAYFILPASVFSVIGIIGGIALGYSSTYKWQTVFNGFGALFSAMTVFGFGLKEAVLLRIIANISGCAYTLIINKLFAIAEEGVKKLSVSV